MKPNKYLLIILLLTSINSFPAELMIYPNKSESEVMEGQPKVMINDIKQSSLCKATIMSLMDYQDNNLTSVQINPISAVVTRYRKADNTKWSWLCKVESNRIIYAAMNVRGPNKITIGRWRIHPDDEKITFNLNDTSLNIDIAYSRNDTAHKSFSIKSVKNWK